MTKFEQSAIIGYWRCGANIFEIAGIMQMMPDKISDFIDYYSKFIQYVRLVQPTAGL